MKKKYCKVLSLLSVLFVTILMISTATAVSIENSRKLPNENTEKEVVKEEKNKKTADKNYLSEIDYDQIKNQVLDIFDNKELTTELLLFFN